MSCSAILIIPIDTENENCIIIPTAVSPNGDGANDVWIISGAANNIDISVEIFNRWGGKIFQSDKYQNDWDGTFKDKPIPAGVYYFVVKISDEDVYTGSLTVLR